MRLILILILALALGASSVALAAFIPGGGGFTNAGTSCAVGTLNFAQACNSGFTPIM